MTDDKKKETHAPKESGKRSSTASDALKNNRKFEDAAGMESRRPTTEFLISKPAPKPPKEE